MRKRGTAAFTLVELVIVIAIVGILAAIAIPRFIDIRTEAFNAQREGIVGSVRAGILTYTSKNQVAQCTGATFPPNLEAWDLTHQTCNGITNGTVEAATTACSTTKACFELVIPGGVTDGAWQQFDATGNQYRFTNPADSSKTTYTYTQTDGTFR